MKISNFGKIMLLFFAVAMIAGCNGGGGSGSTGYASVMVEEDGGNETPDLLAKDSVHYVHNPEPASILLFGLGALGLLRRKKIAVKQQNLKEKGGVK